MIKKIAFELKKNIHSMVNKFGIDIVKSSENFLDEKWLSPMELVYRTHNRHILLRVPVDKVRFLGVHGYKVNQKGTAPFISTLEKYKDNKIKGYKDSTLCEFYSKFQPKTISEYLYLQNTSNNLMNSLPPSGVFLPWQNVDPIEQVNQRAIQVESDNQEHKANISFSGGDPFYGPVSIEKANLEYNRLTKVFDSIQKHGFKVDTKGKDNINAIVLEHGNEYRYFIISGQHRIAALSVLGYEKIALQIYKGLIVRRSEVGFWPGVTNGYFKSSEALAVFDRIFVGLD
jgi:hypothetical protein